MRSWAFLVLLVTVSGCLGSGEVPRDEAPDAPGEEGEESGSEEREAGVQAPVLEPGKAWTYEATGVYNIGQAFTVTVAEASPTGGYLFAGQAQEDLLEDIVWDRVWHGHMSASLNPLDPEGSERVVLFDFPLWDGKTWMDRGREVTVQASPMPTPQGDREGFVMERRHENGFSRWTYSEEVGYMTSFEAKTEGVAFQKLTLVSEGETDAWIWYEPSEGRIDTGGNEPSIEVASVLEDAESVIVSAGTIGEGSIVVQPPAASGMGPWVHQGEGEEAWTYRGLLSTEGEWTFSTQGHEDAFAWISAQPVTWVTS